MKANRILVVIALALVAVTALTIVVINTTDEKSYDKGTPQGVVQSYLDSVFNGDFNTAASYISSESECTATDLDRAFIPSRPRIYLTSTTVAGATAQVKIQVEQGDSGILNNPSTEERVIRLVKPGNTWLLTGIPWPLYDCGVIKK